MRICKNTTSSPKHALQAGVGLVEAIVVIFIVSTALVGILVTSSVFLRTGFYAADKVQALYLLEEGTEAVRYLRDEGYTTNITPLIGAGARYLDPAAGSWTVTTTNTPIFGVFTRTVLLEDVYRKNSDSDIVPVTSGDPKTVDPDTAKLTISVSWGTGSVQTVTYVANIYED